MFRSWLRARLFRGTSRTSPPLRRVHADEKREEEDREHGVHRQRHGDRNYRDAGRDPAFSPLEEIVEGDEGGGYEGRYGGPQPHADHASYDLTPRPGCAEPGDEPGGGRFEHRQEEEQRAEGGVHDEEVTPAHEDRPDI